MKCKAHYTSSYCWFLRKHTFQTPVNACRPGTASERKAQLASIAWPPILLCTCNLEWILSFGRGTDSRCHTQLTWELQCKVCVWGGVRGCCSQGDHKVKLAYCSNYESGKGEQVQETLEACRCLTSVSGGEQNMLGSTLLSWVFKSFFCRLHFVPVWEQHVST